jgi:hypothetical protein
MMKTRNQSRDGTMNSMGANSKGTVETLELLVSDKTTIA